MATVVAISRSLLSILRIPFGRVTDNGLRITDYG